MRHALRTLSYHNVFKGNSTWTNSAYDNFLPDFGICQFSKIRKIGMSDNLDLCVFSEFPEFRFPKIRRSGNPTIRVFRFPEFQISEILDFRKSESPDCRLSRTPNVEFSKASDAMHRRCPDPSKKHGDH